MQENKFLISSTSHTGRRWACINNQSQNPIKSIYHIRGFCILLCYDDSQFLVATVRMHNPRFNVRPTSQQSWLGPSPYSSARPTHSQSFPTSLKRRKNTTRPRTFSRLRLRISTRTKAFMLGLWIKPLLSLSWHGGVGRGHPSYTGGK